MVAIVVIFFVIFLLFKNLLKKSVSKKIIPDLSYTIPTHYYNNTTRLSKQEIINLINYLKKDYKIIHKLGGAIFEQIIEQIFIKNGFKTQLTTLSNDSGVDIIAFNDKIKYFIQCKRWTNVVGINEVQRMKGVVIDQYHTQGIIITTAHFSNPGKESANKNKAIVNIILKDNTDVFNMINKY